MSRHLRSFIVLIWLVLLLMPGQVSAQEQALVIPSGSVVEGNIATFNRSILVVGTVIGDVTSFSGSIVVEGSVTGDLVSYSGEIYILPGGSVDGHVLALTGAVVHDDTAQIAGQTLGSTTESLALTASASAVFGEITASNTGSLSQELTVGVFWGMALLFGTLVAGLWPTRMQGTARTLLALPARSALVGLLSLFLLAGTLALGNTILALSLVGLPLVPIITVVAHIPLVYGLTVFALVALRRFAVASSQPVVFRAGMSLLIVLLILGGIAFVLPWLALLGFYLCAALGLGAAVLSRGGAFGPTLAPKNP